MPLRSRIIGATFTAATLLTSVASAQSGGGGNDKSWVIGYSLTMLCILLGVAAACHPCRRHKY